MSPQSDDDVAVGALATGRIEIVPPGDRRVIVDHTVDGSGRAAVIVVPFTFSRPSTEQSTEPTRRYWISRLP